MFRYFVMFTLTLNNKHTLLKDQLPEVVATEHFSIITACSKFKISFCAVGNVFKSFYHSGPLHRKYFIVFNAINRFNIGVNGPKQNPWMNWLHNTVIIHRDAIEPVRLILLNISPQADQ